ncbi:MAG: DUF3604 domain-containing protein [Deltaproteobacteria bacterium]|nr:DUF3604 domain-containing protein [Deltaproteobacteria bacterium]
MLTDRLGGTRRVVAPLLALLCGAGAALAQPGPWARTETRQPCASFDPYRQPYFGDTHVHTAYSSDAVFAGTREDPRGAYRFAQGEAIGLPPYDAQGNPTRTAQLRRPLDFTAVTDHAEQFGEMQICLTPDLPGYDSPECVSARTQLAAPLPTLPSLLPPLPVIQFLLGYGVVQPPTRFAWCGTDGSNCLAQASLVWEDTQAAAEQFYDRTDACTFTTFVAYEWSGQPGGNNLHRNVIFRNATVPAMPTSYMEQPTPDGLWNTLTTQCLEDLPGCDVLAIPHNPNVSGGLMFAPFNSDGSPLTATSAARRAAMEPLVEMNQHKGDSECRPGVQSTDELCGFEKNNRLQLFSPISDPNQAFPPLNYIRNVLRQGLVSEQALGVNPFQLGLIGSTDTHNSTPGATEEADFGAFGHLGLRDGATPAFMVQRVTPAGIEGNPGGLAVVWAEENSRDALFAAMRRREVYATSGSRPILRFFAGRESGLDCGDAEFVARAYRDGVPMGGTIGPVRGARSPRFGVLAFRDAGTPTSPGTPLQRAQIVKGWVDAQGQSHEQVFDVAGDPNNGAGVDTATCTPTGSGEDSLCAVWEDPEFDPSQRAFYYARVLENPTCRWSTIHCNAQGVDCSGPVSPEYAECCNPAVPKTIQERAWSSPIWYRPEGLVRMRGKLTLRGAARDGLDLELRFAAPPAGLDLATQALVVTLGDDDEIFRVTLPAGTLQQTRPGRWAFSDRTGSLGGVRSAAYVEHGSGQATLRLRAARLDLGAADRVDHFIALGVRAGSWQVDEAALWESTSARLAMRR